MAANLSDFEARKLYKEALKLSECLSTAQIQAAFHSGQLDDDAFIYSCVQQARQSRDSITAKIKRWFKKHKDKFKLARKISLWYALFYVGQVVFMALTIAICFVAGVTLAVSPLSPVFIGSMLAFAAINQLAWTGIGLLLGGIGLLIAKIFLLPKQPSPDQVHRENLKLKTKEANIPSFDNELLTPTQTHAFRNLISLAALERTDPLTFLEIKGILNYVGDDAYTEHYISSNYQLNDHSEKLLHHILSLTFINKLTFINSTLNNAQITNLAKLAQIREIKFFNLSPDNEGIKQLAALPHLDALSFNRLNNPSNETYEALLVKNTTLKKLSIDLSFAPLPNDIEKSSTIIRLLQTNKNLKEITFNLNNDLHATSQAVDAFNQDVFQSNVYLQEIKFKKIGFWNFVTSPNQHPFLERNKKLAVVRENAQTLLNDIKKNNIRLNPEQLSCAVNSVSNQLRQTTDSELANVVSNEVETYKAEMAELANQLHLTMADWLEGNPDRKIGNTAEEDLPRFNFQFACNHFFAITSGSKDFRVARFRAFEQTVGVLSSGSKQGQLEIFLNTFAKYCLDKNNQLISFEGDDQETIDTILISTVTASESEFHLPSDEERLALLQYGLMKQAQDTLLINDDVSLLLQAKQDRFKARFAKASINPDQYQEKRCREDISALWNSFCEAQGAIQDPNMRVLLGALSEYEKKMAAPVSVIRR